MKEVKLTEQDWSVVLQAMNNTPTQDMNTAAQVIGVIRKIQSQLGYLLQQKDAIQENSKGKGKGEVQKS